MKFDFIPRIVGLTKYKPPIKYVQWESICYYEIDSIISWALQTGITLKAISAALEKHNEEKIPRVFRNCL